VARKPKAKPMDVAAFARRVGLTHRAIQKAIETGRLTKSIVYVGGAAKVGDPDLAEQELAANTRPRIDHPPRGDGGDLDEVADSYNRSRAEREAALARLDAARAELAEIELEEKRGSVISVDEVETRLTGVFSSCRSKLLGVPTRCRQRDPGLTREQVEMIESLIREALEDLSAEVAEDDTAEAA